MSRYFKPDGSVTISSLSRPCVARAGGAQPPARRGRRPRWRTCTHAASHSTFSSSATAAGAAPDSAAKPSSASACEARTRQRTRAASVHAGRTWRRHGMCSSGDGFAAEACTRARTTRCARGLRDAAACESASAARAQRAWRAPFAGARCTRRKPAGAEHANAAIAAMGEEQTRIGLQAYRVRRALQRFVRGSNAMRRYRLAWLT